MVNLTIPAFTDALANDAICENDNTCPAGTETTTLALTGVPPFDVISSQPTVIPNPGTSWTGTYTIDAIDYSITADTAVNLSSSSYCDAGPNIATVTVIDQPDIDLRPVGAGSNTSIIFGEVINYGSVDAVDVEVWFDYTDYCSCWDCVPVTVSIPAGGNQPVSFAHSGCSDPIEVRIIVDPDNQIQEWNELNNCVSNYPPMCSSPYPSSCGGVLP
jgi:hypothetical protein